MWVTRYANHGSFVHQNTQNRAFHHFEAQFSCDRYFKANDVTYPSSSRSLKQTMSQILAILGIDVQHNPATATIAPEHGRSNRF